MNKAQKQKIYDAMLIRAWRKNANMDDLRFWLKPYDICVTDPDLIRTTAYMLQSVQRFVGIYLRPLSDRLFDGEPANDLRILNWLATSGLRCQATNRLEKNDKQTNKRNIKKEKELFNLTMDTYAADKEGPHLQVKLKRIKTQQR